MRDLTTIQAYLSSVQMNKGEYVLKRPDEIQYTVPLTSVQSEELEDDDVSRNVKESLQRTVEEVQPIQEMWLGAKMPEVDD